MIATADIDELTARHRSTAERVAQKFAGKLPPAVTFDDLFATCWVAVWNAIRASGAGRDLSGDLEAYAFRSAVNAARSMCRRAYRRGIKGAPRHLMLVVLNESPVGDDGPDLADLVADRGTGNRGAFTRPFPWWNRMLACLPPELRHVVVAYAVRGETFAQIATAEGCCPAEASRRWHQAVAALKAAHPDLETELLDS